MMILVLIFDWCVWQKINLEKVQERWWEAVLVDEPKISVRKIDPSRPITDLDDEAQAKIAELMYNERQKRLGLPQSHEKVCFLTKCYGTRSAPNILHLYKSCQLKCHHGTWGGAAGGN